MMCTVKDQLHGGHISVTSELQKGTTFDLYLPVYNETAWSLEPWGVPFLLLICCDLFPTA